MFNHVFTYSIHFISPNCAELSRHEHNRQYGFSTDLFHEVSLTVAPIITITLNQIHQLLHSRYVLSRELNVTASNIFQRPVLVSAKEWASLPNQGKTTNVRGALERNDIGTK